MTPDMVEQLRQQSNMPQNTQPNIHNDHNVAFDQMRDLQMVNEQRDLQEQMFRKQQELNNLQSQLNQIQSDTLSMQSSRYSQNQPTVQQNYSHDPYINNQVQQQMQNNMHHQVFGPTPGGLMNQTGMLNQPMMQPPSSLMNMFGVNPNAGDEIRQQNIQDQINFLKKNTDTDSSASSININPDIDSIIDDGLSRDSNKSKRRSRRRSEIKLS
jgi:hypothetical protein